MKLWLTAPAAFMLLAAPAYAQHQHGAQPVQQQHRHGPPPAPPQPQTQTQSPHDHRAQQPAQPSGPPPVAVNEHGLGMAMSPIGAYPMQRDASGTSWQPDDSDHGGVHLRHGAWMVMTHALLNGVYDWQGGPRGDEKAFVSGMVMASARREIGAHDTLNLRAMASPDPFMGKSGYPQLFAAGETADGVNHLVDRQHPHDLFMELSASYAHRLGEADSIFVYAGLPGEPAFGPPAFMHRLAAMDSPEAPISHHWLDSTHITFGVLTAGYVHENWKFEASRFRGREPDQDRYDIESGDLDSTALRVSWNPNAAWSLQVSWADVIGPEQLEPDEDETRWSASAIYTGRVGEHGWYSATGAFGRKQRSGGEALDAWLAEAAWRPNEAWTVFTRAERVETGELLAGPPRAVARFSLGAIRDWRVHEHALIGVGALVERHVAPDALAPSYDGDQNGAMAFVRLKIG